MVGKYRDIARQKAKNRQRKCRNVYQGYEWYDNLNQYSKNKIHCSCADCSAKTRNKGERKRGNYHNALFYKKSDLQKVMRQDSDLNDNLGYTIKRKRSKY